MRFRNQAGRLDVSAAAVHWAPFWPVSHAWTQLLQLLSDVLPLHYPIISFFQGKFSKAALTAQANAYVFFFFLAVYVTKTSKSCPGLHCCPGPILLWPGRRKAKSGDTAYATPSLVFSFGRRLSCLRQDFLLAVLGLTFQHLYHRTPVSPDHWVWQTHFTFEECYYAFLLKQNLSLSSIDLPIVAGVYSLITITPS